MSIEQSLFPPADRVRCLRTLIAPLPEQKARALLQVASWMATERTSHAAVSKETVLGWVRDSLAGQAEQSRPHSNVLPFTRRFWPRSKMPNLRHERLATTERLG